MKLLIANRGEIAIRVARAAAERLELLGDKVRARALAEQLGVPIVAGRSEAVDAATAEEFFATQPAGWAMVVKAVRGGGGRGMRAVRQASEIAGAVERANDRHTQMAPSGTPPTTAFPKCQGRAVGSLPRPARRRTHPGEPSVIDRTYYCFMDGDIGEALKGRPGRVTIPIPEGAPGEIVVTVRGGSERYAAWCHTPIPKHAPVVIINQRSARSVDVTPFP